MPNAPVISLEYRQKLESLPAGQLALLRQVADEAGARRLPVYLVGGFVRDLLLGQPGLDLDIVVEGDAVALARALAKKQGGKVTAHPRFGTATWYLDHGPQTVDRGLPSFIDLITARSETYTTPGALPEVMSSTIADDIRRRDFTINTLALRLDGGHFGELYDYFDGLSDLRQSRVRVLHERSFLDDPTRMLRAVRYEQRYGFRIEARTLELIPAALAVLARLSAERLRHELDLILEEPRAAEMLARLDQLGLLKAVAEALPWSVDLRRRLESGLAAEPASGWGVGQPLAGVPFRRALGYSLWLLDLAPAALDVIQARLAFPLAVLKPLRAAAALRAALPTLAGAKPSKWVAQLDGLPLVALYALWLVSAEPALEVYTLKWRHIQPETDGAALKARGLPAGPQYKKILLRLRAAWLDDEVATVQQEKELLEKLLAI